MFDSDVIVVPVVFGLPTLVWIVRMVLTHKQKMAELHRAPASHALEDRIARLEHGVDAIAIEMERIGEGQRFLTKVLTERRELPSSDAASRPGRVTTPH